MPFKKEELKDMSDAALAEELPRLRARLYELKQQAVTEKLENNREPGNIKKKIAQLLTLKRSRELSKETA
ncbi:MAG: 50S ribosomal protein L29 [Phycisphaeraceae bacterium]